MGLQRAANDTLDDAMIDVHNSLMDIWLALNQYSSLIDAVRTHSSHVGPYQPEEGQKRLRDEEDSGELEEEAPAGPTIRVLDSTERVYRNFKTTLREELCTIEGLNASLGPLDQ